MRFITLFALITTAAAGAIPEPRAATCPAKNCYTDTVAPECEAGKPCPKNLIVVTACPWECEAPVPQGCKPRCKPCKAEICPLVCQCEAVCTSGACFKA